MGVNDVVLYPCTVMGTLNTAHVMSLPKGVMEVEGHMLAGVSSQEITSSVQDKIVASLHTLLGLWTWLVATIKYSPRNRMKTTFCAPFCF